MRKSGHSTGLWVILAISLALRVWLAAGGGQGYWPDELMRYGDARNAAYHLVHGDWVVVSRELFGHADHLLFRWVALPPALLDEWLGANAFRTACYFGLFSTAIIALCWGIVHRTGGSADEALLTAGLLAAANSFFFYSRHYFPYDAAMALMAFGWWVGSGGAQGWRRMVAGAMVGAGFLTYNGYWLPGAVILLVLVVQGDRWPERARSAVLAGLGFFLMVGGAVVATRLAGHDLIRGLAQSSATVIQGDFGQGWRVIIDYLWHAEGPLALVWVVSLVLAVRMAWRTRDATLLHLLGAVAVMLVGLIGLSDWTHNFVIYGRLVRPLALFLCFITARTVVLGTESAGWPRLCRPALLCIAALCAAWSFRVPLRQVFPADFLPHAVDVARDLQRTRPGAVQILRAEHLWAVQMKPVPPPHEVILRERHPLQYLPYQYEGFSAGQREELARQDISMRLIRLEGIELEPGETPDTVPPPHFGPLRLRVKFPAAMVPGLAEPLVATGRAGQGDILFVRYVDEAHVRFGIEHWNAGVVLSDPVPVDLSREHELIVSMGSLFPDDFPGSPGAAAWLRQLNSLALVALDGKAVFSEWVDFYRPASGETSVANNFMGGSVVQREFSGSLFEMTRVSLGELGRLLPFARLAMADRGAGWEGASGPWRLRFTLPEVWGEAAEPLLSIQAGTVRESLVIERPDAAHARLRLDRAGGIYRSEVFAVDPRKTHEVVYSSGLLYPDVDKGLFQQHPGWQPLKRLSYASWNGRTVLLRNLEPVQARITDRLAWATFDADTSARDHFSGRVEGIEPVEPDRILRMATQLAQMAGTRSPEWAGHTGPVRLRLRLPREFPPGGTGEPLLVSGITGEGDFLAVFYQQDGQVCFGVDHWGAGGQPVSEPVRLEPGAECELVVSVPFLWPPTDAPLYAAHPEWQEFRRRVVLKVNGQTLLDAPAMAHKAAPETVTLGVNFIGGSTTTASFTGIVDLVESAEVPPPKITSPR